MYGALRVHTAQADHVKESTRMEIRPVESDRLGNPGLQGIGSRG